MKIKHILSIKLIAVLVLSIGFLSACSGGEDPSKVITKFKENLMEVDSGKVDMNFAIKGTSEADLLDFNADLNIAFDHREETGRKGEFHFAVNGEATSEEKIFNGDLDFTVRTLGDDYYLLLNKLTTNDERYEVFKPFVLLYTGKWLHIANDLIPQNVRELQQDSEEMIAKREAARQVFLNAKLFNLVKNHGIEEMGDKKVYHFSIALNEAGVREYIVNSARLDNRELTDSEVEEASKIIQAIEDFQVWIGTDDYYVYKVVLALSGDSLSVPNDLEEAKDVDMKVDITLLGSDYNQDVTVETPADSQEFNPLELLMGTVDFSEEKLMENAEESMEEGEEGEVVEGDEAVEEAADTEEPVEEAETEPAA